MGLIQEISEKIKKNNRIDEIDRLSFRYDKGCYMYGYVLYELEKHDGIYTARIKPDCVSEDDAVALNVDEDFVQKVTDALDTYGVRRWDGFSGCDRRVLDGRSFTLSLRYGGGGHVSAHGYMRWPKGYREFRDAMDELFMSVCPQGDA